MIRAMEMYKEGKLIQREISRQTGIHMATLNKQFRGASQGDRAPPWWEMSAKRSYATYITK